MRTLLSAPQDGSCDPSPLNATPRTESVWPCRHNISPLTNTSVVFQLPGCGAYHRRPRLSVSQASRRRFVTPRSQICTFDIISP
eukprot:8179323-Pyramimonas_sp.AAC.2